MNLAETLEAIKRADRVALCVQTAAGEWHIVRTSKLVARTITNRTNGPIFAQWHANGSNTLVIGEPV